MGHKCHGGPLVAVTVHCTCPKHGRKRRKLRFVPRVGPVLEQSGPVAKTPQFKSTGPPKGEPVVEMTLTSSQLTTVHAAFKDKGVRVAPVDVQDRRRHGR